MSISKFLSTEEKNKYEAQGGDLINLSTDQALEYGRLGLFRRGNFMFVVNQNDIRVMDHKSNVIGNYQINPIEYIKNKLPIKRLRQLIDDIYTKITKPNNLSDAEAEQAIQGILKNLKGDKN